MQTRRGLRSPERQVDTDVSIHIVGKADKVPLEQCQSERMNNETRAIGRFTSVTSTIAVRRCHISPCKSYVSTKCCYHDNLITHSRLVYSDRTCANADQPAKTLGASNSMCLAVAMKGSDFSLIYNRSKIKHFVPKGRDSAKYAGSATM